MLAFSQPQATVPRLEPTQSLLGKSGRNTDNSTHQQHCLPYLDAAAFHAQLPSPCWLNGPDWFNQSFVCIELGRGGTGILLQVAEKSEVVAIRQGCLQHTRYLVQAVEKSSVTWYVNDRRCGFCRKV